MLRLAAAIVCASVGVSAGSASAQPQPNIIVIMSDDVGYNEVGFNSALLGTPTQFLTPNLDALAGQSAVMRQGYAVAALCSMSRAGLLTGNYQQRLGFEENLGNDLNQQWGYKGNETLLPDRLKALGYTTGMVGKWHNGYINGVNRPTDMGFDEFFGFLSGSRQYYGDGAPSNLMLRDNTVVEGQWRTQGNPATYDPVRGRYLTDAFGDEAVDYINRHADDPNPFYLHLAFTASHTPFGVKQQDMDVFSHIADNTDRMFAAMTYALDRNVGNVMNALQANGIASNTIVVYVNDNGGTSINDNGTLRGFKGYTWEGGIRVPFTIKAPGLTPGPYDYPVTMYDLVPTLVAAAGGTVPAAETAGVDVMPYLSGAQTGRPHDLLFWRGQEIWAVRKGDWKLARPNEPNVSVLSLYNLATDPQELNNRVNAEPALAAELTREFTFWEATLKKPEFGALGLNDKNNFDHFVFRNNVAPTTNWNAANAWLQAGPLTPKTMLRTDAYANAVLEFTTRDDADYTATNNMLRVSMFTYMLNELRLTGNFTGATSRNGTINGNAVILTKSLTGQLPRISLDASAGVGAATFAFNLNNELQLLDDLEIVGNGTQNVVINGVIKNYFEPRGVTKSGTSNVTLTANNTFGGNLVVAGGGLRIAGAGAAINGAASVSVATPGQLTLAGGLIRTGSISLAPGAQFQFQSGAVEITGTGTDLGSGPLNIGLTGASTMSLAAGASATSAGLRIGFNADSQLNLAAGAVLTTQGDAAIAFNNAGTPAGSAATVSGAGAMWSISGDLAVGQHGKAGLTVANGATMQVLGASTLAAEPGSVATAVVGGAGALAHWSSGSMNVGGGPSGGGTATLTINSNGIVEATGTLAIRAGDSVTLAGGELWVGQLDNSHGGSFNWQSGKVRLTGAGGLAIGPGGPHGASVTINATHPLEVAATTTLLAGGGLTVNGGTFTTNVLQLNGGAFTAPDLSGVGGVQFTSGALTLNGGATGSLNVGPGGVTGAAGAAEVVLDAGEAWTISGTTTLSTGGELTVNGGSFQTAVLHLNGGRFAAANLAGVGSLDFDFGELAIMGDVTIAAGEPLGATVDLAAGQTLDVDANLFVGTPTSPGALTIYTGGAVDVVGATTIAEMGGLTLAGGTLSTASLATAVGGSFTWTSGEIAFTDGLTATAGADLGAAITLDANRSLRVADVLTIAADGAVALDGGALSVGDVTRMPGDSFTWLSGQLEITGAQGLLIGPGGLIGDAVVLSAGHGLSVTHKTSIAVGGSLSVEGGTFVTGELDMLGGSFTAADLTGVAELSMSAGSITLTGPAGATIGTGGVLPTTLTLDAGKALHVTATTDLATGGSLTVAGGAFTTGVLALNGGSFTAADLTGVAELSMSAGAIALTGPGGVTLGAGGTSLMPIVLHAADSLAVTGVTTLATGASLAVDGGTFTSGGLTLAGGSFAAPTLTGVGSLDFQSGSLTLTEEDVTVGPGGQLGAAVSLSASRSLHVTGMTTIAATGSLSVADGAFTTGVLALNGGSYAADDLTGVAELSMSAGTIALTGPGGVTLGSGGTPVTAPIVLHAADSLAVTGVTTLATDASLAVDGGTFTSGGLTLAGGSFSAPTLSGVGPLDFQSGSLTLTQEDVTVGPGGQLGAFVALSASRSLHVTGMTTVAATGWLSIADGGFTTGVLKLDGGGFDSADLTGIGAVQFDAGSMTLIGAAGATIGTGGVLPSSLTLDAGKALHVAATTNLATGGSLTVADGAFTTGVLALHGGSFTAVDFAGIASVEFNSGSINVTGPAGVTIGPGTPLGPAVTLGSGSSMDVEGTTTIVYGGLLTVAGGAFTTDVLAISGGTYAAPDFTGLGAVEFGWGELKFTGDFTIGPGGALEQALGGELVVGLGRRLTVAGTATLTAATRVGGGRLSVGNLVNPQLLDFDAGTLDLTNTNLVVGAGGLFGSLLTVRTDTTLNVAQAITVDAGSLVQIENYGQLTSASLVNNGEVVLDGFAAAVETSGVLTNAATIRGAGRVGGPVVNAATGSVLVAGGERLRFLGPTFQNLGHASAIGTSVAPAELEFAGAATNAASTGLITGASARIRFEGGATNEGSIALTGGDNYVYGAIANDGEVVVTGGATATFYGDVVNDGVIRVSTVGTTNSVAVFLGAVTGDGGTEGGGDVFFEGDLQPGEAFAAATFDNDVHFGAFSTIAVDLAGTAPGVTYDQVNVLGSLTLGGTLAVSLENGFVPQYGNIFEIISAAEGLTGTFGAVSLPALTGNLAWQVAYDADSVSLLVSGEHAADFDVDGDVDGADFLSWQRNLGTTSATSLTPGDANFDRAVTAADLPIWRSQFGTAPPAFAAARAIPEPTSAALAALASLIALSARRRRAAA